MAKKSDARQKADVVLVSLFNTVNNGIRTISSFLKEKGFRTKMVFVGDFKKSVKVNNTKKLLAAAVKCIDSVDARFVGVSTMIKHDMDFPTDTLYSLHCIKLLKCLKKSGHRVILGGPLPTMCPEEGIGYADMVCVGEGEYPMLELLQGKDPKKIKGFWVREGKKVYRNEPAKLIQDLDSLPFPDYSEEDSIFIDTRGKINYKIDLRYNLHMTITRGCPFSCSYCCVGIFKGICAKKQVWFRKKSPTRAIEEILHIKKQAKNLNMVYFDDDIFPTDEKWIDEFCKEYSRVKIPFFIFVHPKMMQSEKILLKLKKSGLKSISIGIQSLNEHVLNDVLKRNTSRKEIMKAVNLLKNTGIDSIFVDLLIGNPFETKDDKINTLKFIKKIHPIKANTYTLRFYPKSEITKIALNNGVITKKEYLDNIGKNYNMPVKAEDYPWVVLTHFAKKRHIPIKLVVFLSKINIGKNFSKLVLKTFFSVSKLKGIAKHKIRAYGKIF